VARLAIHGRPLVIPEIAESAEPSPAVVLLAELEPRGYDVGATASALENLADEGLLQASLWVLPFLFMAQKTRYRAAGGSSPGPGELIAIAERVAASLASWGITHVDTAACEGDRSLAIRILAAAERGFRTIVVAQTFIAESLEVDRAKREVDALRLSDRGITVSYTEPLWSSARCAALVCARALAVASDLPSCGVVLVGQAQPEERSRIAEGFDLQETGYLNQIRAILLERGISEGHVRIAWADWRSPEVTGSVRHLAATGCRTVIVVPACFPLDSITTMLDIPMSVRQSRVDQSVNVLTLHGWHDDPGLVEALRGTILSALEPPEKSHAPLSGNL
jgi:protoheme ferro-lyase